MGVINQAQLSLTKNHNSNNNNSDNNNVNNNTKNKFQNVSNNVREEDDAQKLPKEVLIVAQEIKIVKALACNDLVQRNKQMRKLRKWLQLRAQSSIPFNEESFMRIWKGLYYNMWYSDKPLVQEELAEQLAKLLNCFGNNVDLSIKFFSAFLKTMINEWFGIDQWRIDKFLMLVRRMLRYMLKILKQQQPNEWPIDFVRKFNELATSVVIQEKILAKGLTMHYMDIFLEELAKVAAGNITDDQVNEFLKPFVRFLVVQKDGQMVNHCRTKVFNHLLYQSGLGREYTEKYDAWKIMGFPTRHIDDLEPIQNVNGAESDNEIEMADSGNETENESKELDPRAGNVDVYMPVLPLNGRLLILELEGYLYKHEMPMKRRKSLKNLLEIFRKYDQGTFPLGVKTVPRFEVKSRKPLVKDKIEKLDNLENELYGVDRKLKQLNKRKRRRLLRSLNFEEIDEDNYEAAIEKALPTTKSYLLKRKNGAVKAMMYGWLEEELDQNELPSPSASSLLRINKKPNNKNNINVIKKQMKKMQKQKKQKRKIKENNLHNKINGSIENSEIAKDNLQQEEKSKIVKDNNISTTMEKQEVTINQQEQEQQQQSSLTANNSNGININKEDNVPTTVAITISESRNVVNDAGDNNTKRFTPNEWELPLKEGEVEYFVPSRKLKLQDANYKLNMIKDTLKSKHSTPLRGKRASMSAIKTTSKTAAAATTITPTISPPKRVRIFLQHNTAQHPREYIQQIKSSPNVPFDATKKPIKSVLKPNSTPSPINPFYKKKLGLNFLNDTL